MARCSTQKAGRMFLRSPSSTRISTTSTSYPPRDDSVDDHEPDMKPLAFGGEVDATSVGHDQYRRSKNMIGVQALTSVLDVGRNKEILRTNVSAPDPSSQGRQRAPGSRQSPGSCGW
jgi:hypothetical protein